MSVFSLSETFTRLSETYAKSRAPTLCYHLCHAKTFNTSTNNKPSMVLYIIAYTQNYKTFDVKSRAVSCDNSLETDAEHAMSLAFYLALLLTVLILYKYYRHTRKLKSCLRDIPTPPGLPYVGHVLYFTNPKGKP